MTPFEQAWAVLKYEPTFQQYPEPTSREYEKYRKKMRQYDPYDSLWKRPTHPHQDYENMIQDWGDSDDIHEKTGRAQASIDPYEDEEMVDDLYVPPPLYAPPPSRAMPINPFKRAKTDALLAKLMSGQQLTNEELEYLLTLN